MSSTISLTLSISAYATMIVELSTGIDPLSLVRDSSDSFTTIRLIARSLLLTYVSDPLSVLTSVLRG